MAPNFEEFLKTLSQEERKNFINELIVYLLNGQPQLLKRTTLKLSTGLSQDEVKKAISDAIGILIEQTPNIDFEAAKMRLRIEKEMVDNIIENYKAKLDSNPKTGSDKYEELIDIGKFIVSFNSELKLFVPDEILKFPDFIVLLQERKIGIEHTRLMAEGNKAIFKSAKYYIQKAQDLIENELSHLSKTVNIFIDYNKNVIGESNFKNRNFNADQREEVAQIIASYVKSELTGGNVFKPAFISQVKITSNLDSKIYLELAESYFTILEFAEMLTNRISSKEAKVVNYRSIKFISEVWLVIVVDDINSFSGFDLTSVGFPKIENSSFDQIFLFEKFGRKIYPLLNA